MPHEPEPPEDNEHHVNAHETVTYKVSNHVGNNSAGALVDRGANGGIAGNDVRIIGTTNRTVDVSGIDNHQMTNLRIVTAGGVVPTQHGEVIAILHQYAHMPTGRTIHSSGQIEAHGNHVHDKSMKVKGGLQCIKTLDEYVHPLDICNGLPYVPMKPYTDTEWTTLPHVIWTSDMPWDPTVLDNKISDNARWYKGISDVEKGFIKFPFNRVGEYLGREPDYGGSDYDKIYGDAEANIHSQARSHEEMIIYSDDGECEEDLRCLTNINSIGTIVINRCEFAAHVPILTQTTLQVRTERFSIATKDQMSVAMNAPPERKTTRTTSLLSQC